MTATDLPTNKKVRIREDHYKQLLEAEATLKSIEHLLNVDRPCDEGLPIEARVNAAIQARRNAQYTVLGRSLARAKEKMTGGVQT
jgi:hypothetical protein